MDKELFRIADSILCDNPFKYEHGFCADLTWIDKRVVSNDIIELLGLIQDAGASTVDEIFVNGTPCTASILISFSAYAETGAARWDKDIVILDTDAI